MLEKGFCYCGCRQKTPIALRNDKRRGHIKGEPLRFLTHHNLKGHPHNYIGGRVGSGDGYIKVHSPGHPSAAKSGYILEHIFIASKALGKPLPPKAHVHHVNEIRDDNRNKNLVICQDLAYHKLLHRRQKAYMATGNVNAEDAECVSGGMISKILLWLGKKFITKNVIRKEKSHNKKKCWSR